MDIKYDYRRDYRGGMREYFRESSVLDNSGRGSMSQEWSRVVSGEA